MGNGTVGVGLRAAGAPSAVEDPLAELARLVEASRPKGAVVSAAPVVAAAPVVPPAPVVTPPLEAGALRPAFDSAGEPEAELEFGQTEGSPRRTKPRSTRIRKVRRSAGAAPFQALALDRLCARDRRRRDDRFRVRLEGRSARSHEVSALHRGGRRADQGAAAERRHRRDLERRRRQSAQGQYADQQGQGRQQRGAAGRSQRPDRGAACDRGAGRWLGGSRHGRYSGGRFGAAAGAGAGGLRLRSRSQSRCARFRFAPTER